ncbi:hypothetical protein [Hymenobacter sp. DG25A]|uniref:hypothetical protein n=1 Tax=Hymenobacter sp. DG25A TaxID=1385663 RepID=UPI0012F740FC|nr:hypothetical protein [Hymenobacter sp. DG25A]
MYLIQPPGQHTFLPWRQHMQPFNYQQAHNFVNTWLATHPDRLRYQRNDPALLRNWCEAAERRLLTGIPDDAEFILQRFANKAESSSM